MRIHRDERGQTIILVAFSLPLLLGFIGLATDVGALFKDKRTLQTAADAAALAAALNYNTANPSAWHDSAIAAATANGFTAGPDVTVTPLDGPTWPSSNYVGQTGYIEVTITKAEPTIFLALFGHPSVTVLARAVAAKTGPPAACIYTVGDGLNPPGPGLTLTGSMQSAPNPCGLVVDSNASPPMVVTGGPLSMKSIGTVGNCTGCGGTPPPVSGIIPYSDPLSSLPQIVSGGSCTNTLNQTGGTVVLSPGCYSTFTATGANVSLNPGTYVLNGTGMNLTGGTLSGAGVTFYINSGNVTINGTTLNLSAPNDKSQTYNGILFYQSPTDTSMASISGLTNSTIAGIFYFPGANLSLGNISGTLYTDFVAQSLTVTVSIPLTFGDYASAPGVTSSPLSSAVLVE
jgi:Flp pilus assembly protein TadG